MLQPPQLKVPEAPRKILKNAPIKSESDKANMSCRKKLQFLKHGRTHP